jgi:recombination directionality factor gp3-like protein
MPIQIGRRIDPSVIQRSMRELGRIRTGYSDAVEGKTWRRPRRSDTLILTSTQRLLIDNAAALWGGEPEQWTPQGANTPVWRVVTDQAEIPALLPQGQPLSTMFELWDGGRCTRRCDGITEERSQRQPIPCVCAAQHGPNWHELRRQPNAPPLCKVTGRLNVYLEDLGDFGWWRVEVHSFFAVSEMSGVVDWIKGRLGPDPAIRIRLAIEQRSGKILDGKDKLVATTYPVVAIRLADHTAIQILSGVEPKLMIEGLPDRRALTQAPESRDDEGQRALPAAPAQAATPPKPAQAGSGAQEPPAGPPLSKQEWLARFAAARDLEELRGMWKPAGNDGALDQEGRAAYMAAKTRIEAEHAAAEAEPVVRQPPPDPEPDTPAAPDETVVDADIEPDRLAVWNLIVAKAGELKWSLDRVTADMKERTGHDRTSADGWAMQLYLDVLNGKMEATG